MPRKRRSFQKPLGTRRYRKLFVLAVEGVKTEPQYFAVFNDAHSVIRVNCLKGRHDSDPDHVLKRMADYLKNESLKSSDEAWLVVDRDQWTEEQLSRLHAWAQTQDHYGFALSNPKFEYWLLLHFEEGHGIASPRECTDRLERHLPNYDKGIDPRHITRDRIELAIRRARRRDTPACPDWPRAPGGTTVYRLVERLLVNPGG